MTKKERLKEVNRLSREIVKGKNLATKPHKVKVKKQRYNKVPHEY